MDSAQHAPLDPEGLGSIDPEGLGSIDPEGLGSIDPSHEWVADDFNHPSLPHQSNPRYDDAALVPAAEPFEDWADDARPSPRP